MEQFFSFRSTFKLSRSVKRNTKINVSQLVVFQFPKMEIVKERLMIGHSITMGGIIERKRMILGIHKMT